MSVVGIMADLQGTYRWAFVTLAIVILAGAIVAFLATRPGLPGMLSKQQLEARTSQ